MSIQTRFTDLPPLGPGNTVRLHTHEFSGTGCRRSAYIQAGLHADEHPGLLVIQHLQEILVELHQQGRILGRIVLCPFANPVGMTQNVLGFWIASSRRPGTREVHATGVSAGGSKPLAFSRAWSAGMEEAARRVDFQRRTDR